MEQFSSITIREHQEVKRVKITSALKPEIINKIINKWQSLIDLAAKLANVPSGLIMRLNSETIEVFLKSKTIGNPYEVGEEAKLVHGLYCETVIGTQNKLLIPDATKSKVWKENNPDVDINMISYLGHPINWPDGEVFGTVCILDNKENHYNESINNIVFHIKQHIETDLNLLLTKEELRTKVLQLQTLNSTKSRFLSLISHDLRGKLGSVKQIMHLVSNHFDEYDKSELKRLFEVSERSIKYSYSLMEDLLTWAKADFLELKPSKTIINLSETLEHLINEFSEEISLKKIKIDPEFFSRDTTILADENMFQVIIRNLISNAIKYSHKNGIITIHFHPSSTKTIIEISDSGIGMHKDTVDKLFVYNPQHEPQGTEGESSAGIGLMLIKEFLDKHEASIEIESIVGKGTKFTITWP